MKTVIFSVCLCILLLLMVVCFDVIFTTEKEIMIQSKDNCTERLDNMEKRLKNLENNRFIKIENVTITAYTSNQPPPSRTSDITAFGTRPRHGIIAISKPLERIGLQRGDVVWIPTVGRFTVEDRMHQTRWTDYRADIWLPNVRECYDFGVRISHIFIEREMEL